MRNTLCGVSHSYGADVCHLRYLVIPQVFGLLYSLSYCQMRFKGFVGCLQKWWLKDAAASRHKHCVCTGVPTGDHHRVFGHQGLYFWFFSYLKSQRCFIFYCQLYFLVRFFSCVVFVFWFTCWLDIYDSKACLTSKMQIFD